MYRAHARGDIAQMAFLEELQRQAQQVGKDIAHPLQTQPRGQVHHRPAPQQADANLQQQGEPEAQSEHHQQIAISGDQHLVHHPLHEEWRQHYKHLQRDRQRQDLSQCAP